MYPTPGRSMQGPPGAGPAMMMMGTPMGMPHGHAHAHGARYCPHHGYVPMGMGMPMPPMMMMPGPMHGQTPHGGTGGYAMGSPATVPRVAVGVAASPAATTSTASRATSQWKGQSDRAQDSTPQGHAIADSNAPTPTKSNAQTPQTGLRAPQSAVIGTTVHVKQKTGIQMERELSGATRAELVGILVELCGLNSEAQAFVSSKASLIALRTPTTAEGAAMASPAPARGMDGTGASVMRLGAAGGPTPARGTACSVAASPACGGAATPIAAAATAAATVETPSAAVMVASVTRTPATLNAASRTTAANRSFCHETHPCLRAYGGCRHPASCVYAREPQNLCLAWVCGHCTSGADCVYVHRLPDNCSVQLRLLYDLRHGARRDDPAVVEMICRSARDAVEQRDAAIRSGVESTLRTRSAGDHYGGDDGCSEALDDEEDQEEALQVSASSGSHGGGDAAPLASPAALLERTASAMNTLPASQSPSSTCFGVARALDMADA